MSCCSFFETKTTDHIRNGRFKNSLIGWNVRLQTGSDPKANWFDLTSETSPVNGYILPFPARGNNNYALFETPAGGPASAVLFQTVTIPHDKPFLAFDWYAFSGASCTTLTIQRSMDLNLVPNFQARVDLMDPKAFKQGSDDAIFTDPSNRHVVQNLVPPSVTGTAQLDGCGVNVIGGFSRAIFDVCKHAGKTLVLAFRVVSAPCFEDDLLFGVANVQFVSKHHLKDFLTSGFFAPKNARVE